MSVIKGGWKFGIYMLLWAVVESCVSDVAARPFPPPLLLPLPFLFQAWKPSGFMKRLYSSEQCCRCFLRRTYVRGAFIVQEFTFFTFVANTSICKTSFFCFFCFSDLLWWTHTASITHVWQWHWQSSRHFSKRWPLKNSYLFILYMIFFSPFLC